MRRIVVDTETTGLEVSQGHRIIEIGCVELIDRHITGNTFHHYINPQRQIEAGAVEVHGITDRQLEDKPVFAGLAEALLAFIGGAELIIHNAPFDVGFLNHEFARAKLGDGVVEAHCTVLDTLVLARQLHAGQKNSLDALCQRYQVDNTQRTLHGALLDAEILADVYLAMTGGQITLLGASADRMHGGGWAAEQPQLLSEHCPTPVVKATEAECSEHEKWLQLLDEQVKQGSVWRRLDQANQADQAAAATLRAVPCEKV